VKFSELSDRAKEHAMYKYSEFMAELNDWWEYLHEDLLNDLSENYGIDDVKVEFSLAYVQGDHVTFIIDNERLSDKLMQQAGYGSVKEFAEKLATKFGVNEDDVPELVDELLDNSSIYGKVGMVNPDGLTVRLEGLYDTIVDLAEDDVDRDLVYEQIDQLDGAVNETLYDKAKEFYRQLRDTWEAETTEEAVEEAAEANGWEYDEDGDMI